MAKVMFVDDDRQLLEGLRLSLRKMSCKLLTESSAESAMATLETADIDVLVCDLSLPGLGGLALLKHCFLSKPHIIQVILSGRITMQATLHAINELNVFKILEKPCSPDVLQEVIQDSIAESELRKGRQALLDIAINRILDDEPQFFNRKNCEKTINKLQQHSVELLSPREVQVLTQFALGQRTASIAEKLSISQHTVRNHLKSIFSKLQVHSQQELLDLLAKT